METTVLSPKTQVALFRHFEAADLDEPVEGSRVAAFDPNESIF